MKKSRNNIRKNKKISLHRKIYGGQVQDEVKVVRACPNSLEPEFKWKYGDNCYKSCQDTRDKTFRASWDDEHDQRTCEADTPQNRRRYNLTRLAPSTAYKGYRVGRDAASSVYNAAVVVKDAVVAGKNKAVSAYNAAAPYVVAGKDAAVESVRMADFMIAPPIEWRHQYLEQQQSDLTDDDLN